MPNDINYINIIDKRIQEANEKAKSAKQDMETANNHYIEAKVRYKTAVDLIDNLQSIREEMTKKKKEEQ